MPNHIIQLTMKKQIITRDELYEMVWSEPMRTIAKRYNISIVG